MWLNWLGPSNVSSLKGFVKEKKRLQTNLVNELQSSFAKICLFMIVSPPPSPPSPAGSRDKRMNETLNCNLRTPPALLLLTTSLFDLSWTHRIPIYMIFYQRMPSVCSNTFLHDSVFKFTHRNLYVHLFFKSKTGPGWCHHIKCIFYVFLNVFSPKCVFS